MSVPPVPLPPITPKGPQALPGKLPPGVTPGLPSPIPQEAQGLSPGPEGGTASLDILKQEPFGQLIKSIKAGQQLDPGEKFILMTVSKDIAPGGLLSKVLEQAGDAIVKFTEAKLIVQNGIQESMGIELKELQKTLQPLVATLPEGQSSMKIPAILQNIAPEIRQKLIPLVAESATTTVQNFLQIPIDKPLTHAQVKAQHFVTSLIALKIAYTPKGNETQIVIPKEALTASLPPEELVEVQNTIGKQLQTAQVEYTTLFKQAETLGLNVQALVQFRDVPQQAMILMNTMSHAERSFLLSFLGIWAANYKAIEQAFFAVPYQHFEERRDAIRGLISSQATLDTSGRTPADSEQKMSLLNQLLMQPPTLANLLAIGQLLDELEDALLGKALAGQLVYTTLLYNAAREIQRVAFLKPSAEYPVVGALHQALSDLALDLEESLPKNVQALTANSIQALAKQMSDALEAVKYESHELFLKVLVGHPRLMLLLVHTDSPLIEDVYFPFLPERLLTEGQKDLLERAIYSLATVPLFQKYQPLALAKIFAEVKHTSSPLTRSVLKVCYKAVHDASEQLSPEERNSFKEYLGPLLGLT